VSLPLTVADADGDQVQLTVEGLPAGLSVQGATITGTISPRAVARTTSSTAIASDTFVVTVRASDGRSTTTAQLRWTVRDTHLPMPELVGFYGCGDCGAGPDEPFPRISAMFSPRYSSAYDPARPGAAPADTIWHQEVAPGQAVRWGQPMTVHFWDPGRCTGELRGLPSCQGGLARGWG
jgi:hypothetical protein